MAVSGSGRMSPNFTNVGTLTAPGSTQFTANSKLVVQTDGMTKIDKLAIPTGGASISGSGTRLEITNPGGVIPVVGQRFLVLSGAVTGQFAFVIGATLGNITLVPTYSALGLELVAT